MTTREHLKNSVLHSTAATFETTALAVFRYQYAHNPVYRQFIDLLKIAPDSVRTLDTIPFLPIGFFKNFDLKTGEWQPQMTFSSSGTTGETTSRHHVREVDFYARVTAAGFAEFYGNVAQYSVLALLPAYLERQGSSLVFMANYFIEQSQQPNSGFFLYDYAKLAALLRLHQVQKIPTLLLGVSFALWDLAEQFPQDLSDIILMETGGMKGRRREVTREELHAIFGSAFNAKNIHSEYGMTELLSQGYSQGGGIFRPTATMRVLTREITDPLTPQQFGKVGGINVIDLANLDTCSFIATDDLGRVFPDGSFEVLGRFDNSDVRGCNLLLRWFFLNL